MDEPASASRFDRDFAPDSLAVIRRAAELQGRSVDDFVIRAVQETAQRTIMERQIIRMSVDDQRAFVAAIIDPPNPNDSLVRAAEAHRRLVEA